jgi:hypothetical protein
MKFDFSNVENDFDFTKEIKKIEKNNLKTIALNSFKKISLFISFFSLLSLFLVSNNISFQQQIDFLKRPKFNDSLFIFYSLYLMMTIIKETLFTYQKDSNLKQNFSSIWLPLKMTMFISVLIPISTNHSSVFSQVLIEIIKVLNNLF